MGKILQFPKPVYSVDSLNTQADRWFVRLVWDTAMASYNHGWLDSNKYYLKLLKEAGLKTPKEVGDGY